MNEEIKVSELDLASEIRDTDQIMLVQGGINKKVTGEKINDRTISDSYGTSEQKGYSQRFLNNHIVNTDATNSNNIKTWLKESKNLFNKDVALNGFIAAAHNQNDNWYYTTISNWKVGDTLVTSGGRAIISFFNGDINISYRDITNNTIEIPINTTIVYVSTLKENSQFQIEVGSTATTYKPFVENKQIIVDNEIFSETVNVGANENNNKVWFKPIGKNLFKPTLFNENNSITMANGTASIVGDEFSFKATASDMYFGQIRAAGDSYDPNRGILIPVKPSTTYQILITNSIFANCLVTKYDYNKVSLGYEGLGSTNKLFTTPSNCYYLTIRVGYNQAVSGTTYSTKVMIAETNEKIDYVRFEEPSIYVENKKIYTKPNHITLWSGDATTANTEMPLSESYKNFEKIGFLYGPHNTNHKLTMEYYTEDLPNSATIDLFGMQTPSIYASSALTVTNNTKITINSTSNQTWANIHITKIYGINRTNY